MNRISSRFCCLAFLGFAGLTSACGGAPVPSGPPSSAELIGSSMPRLQLEALCPVRAMSEGASFDYFDRTAGELGLSPDDGEPVSDPRYDAVEGSRWVVNDRVETGNGAPQGRTTIWIAQLQPGAHDPRYLTMTDRNGRHIGAAGHGDVRRYESAVSCVLHIEGLSREDALAVRSAYQQNFYDGLLMGDYPSGDAPAPLFAEWRWINGNNNELYVETDLLAPEPGDTGVTLIRRYFFW